MQQLLEARSPLERLASEGRRGGQQRRLRYVIFAGCVLFTLYMLLLRGDGGAGSHEGSFSTSGKSFEISPGKTLEKEKRVESVGNAREDEGASTKKKEGGRLIPTPSIQLLPPWGYNKDRNVPRAQAILSSIAADVANGRVAEGFTVVDYGADQGYFSISTAALFEGKAYVMGIEMGGVGGEIWKKANSQDVLAIQEAKIKELGVEPSMHICQTKVVPESFFRLRAKGLVSDYQFVLSVFHWFDLPTRAEFEKAISTLFLNARTTFIELPIIGDNSPLIRKQVGWKNFVKWYDGRTDMTQIIAESAESQGLSVKVALIASVPWVKWQRETYRVDVLSYQGEAAPAISFGCEERRAIYGCASRERYSSCGSSK